MYVEFSELLENMAGYHVGYGGYGHDLNESDLSRGESSGNDEFEDDSDLNSDEHNGGVHRPGGIKREHTEMREQMYQVLESSSK